jgi:hypothetical protein
VGGASPLAIDHFVKVVGIADIGGSQISLSTPPKCGGVHCIDAGANLSMLGRVLTLVSRVCVAETTPRRRTSETNGAPALCPY